MKKQLTICLTGSVLAISSFAFAGNQQGAFSISPVIGGYTANGIPSTSFKTNLLVGARLGYNFTKAIGIEALFDYSPRDHNVNFYRYGGELLYHFMPDNNFVPYVAAGYAGFNEDKAGIYKKTHGAFDYGIGAKYFLNDSFALRGDVRHVMSYVSGKSFNDVLYTVGAYIPFGGSKPAPKAVEPAPEPPKAAPAPLAPTSNIISSPASITKGESSTLSWSSENTSSCEIQPGIGPVQTKGSMKVTPADNTPYTLVCKGDGGSTTSNTSVAVAAPVVEAAQPKASAAAQRFCSKPAVLAIAFDGNKSDIKPRYAAELKTVGDFLKEFPKAKGEISGHTDSVGSNAFNQKLSQRRADSVKKYIVEKLGIDGIRITAKGYGESKPIATNKTRAGKAKNRRIEANFTCE
ncbi:MAG TPA: OmpA family protein [Deltaproteobacteria bacterium]|nr:OmpA family protein [Deltaproteobacteria bacterium]